VGFDFSAAFGRAVRVVNDAAMQALGSYRRGRLLYLGFGTGLGSAMIVGGVLAPMELAHLPYREGRTYEDFVGARGIERLGEERWRSHVIEVISLLKTALEADDTVVGGGNANRLRELPPGTRRVDDDAAFVGGLHMWDEHGPEGARRAVLVEVHPTAEALMRAAAETFVRASTSAVRAGGRFVVALSGGTTPRGLYQLLAQGPYLGQVDWERVELFWSDERCVPPDHPASNFRMARESLLDRLTLPAKNVHRIHGEDDPAEAAASYERVVRTALSTPAGPPRRTPGSRFDLILLGLGEDGHTASLLPDSAAVREQTRWVVADRVAASSMARITLTLPVINAAAEVVFLVSGGEKAAMLQRVTDQPSRHDLLPAQLVAPRDGRVRWLVDRAAASGFR
jgi:6-phosphogluconolactonase